MVSFWELIFAAFAGLYRIGTSAGLPDYGKRALSAVPFHRKLLATLGGSLRGGMGPPGVGFTRPLACKSELVFRSVFRGVICSDLHGNFHMNRWFPKV